MNQSTSSRSIPLPLWVTVGFYPFYLFLWLGFCITGESKDFFKNGAILNTVRHGIWVGSKDGLRWFAADCVLILAVGPRRDCHRG